MSYAPPAHSRKQDTELFGVTSRMLISHMLTRPQFVLRYSSPFRTFFGGIVTLLLHERWQE